MKVKLKHTIIYVLVVTLWSSENQIVWYLHAHRKYIP